MKISYLTGWCLLAMVASGGAANVFYSSGFEEPDFNKVAFDLDGQDGWEVSGTSLPDIAFVEDLTVISGQQSAALGGAFGPVLPDNAIAVSHPVSFDLGGTLLKVDFMVMQSSVALVGQDDAFGFGLESTGFSVMFEPMGGTLEVAHYDGATRTAVPSTALSYSDQGMQVPYNLTVRFEEEKGGADASFEAIITGGGGSPIEFGGTLAGRGATVVSGVSAHFEVIGDGDNTLVFDNLVVVPEPHSLVLCFLGAGLLFRRRRA